MTVIEYSPAQEAFAADQQFRQGLTDIRRGLVEAARGAYALRETAGWLALGASSLNEYLAAPEITVSRAEFYRLADIWESYVLNGGVDPLELREAAESKLEVPLPALKKGLVEAEEAVGDAVGMTRKEMRDKYKTLLGDDPHSSGEPSDGANGSGELNGGTGSSLEPQLHAAQETAVLLRSVLRRVMDEIGAPEKKKMSNSLRDAIMFALELADERLA
jgi:hypothetical protein